MEHQLSEKTKMDCTVRPLQEADLRAANNIMRVAFGTFLGIPEPATFMGDKEYIRTRWITDPSAAFGAEVGGEIVGSNFATNWGSVGFFGPLTIRPDFWDRGIGSRLMQPIMECFSSWGTRHAGLFTFAHSQKHAGLYQKFGFWPRFLTALMSRKIEPQRKTSAWSRFSEVPKDQREASLRECRKLTDTIYEGLDISREIRAIAAQTLGDTVLLWSDSTLVGLAACHYGPGTEGGSGVCYIKFGAVRPGPAAEQTFNKLLNACEEMAAAQGLSNLVAGVNTARHEAYRAMMVHGFHTESQGVAMHKPNEPGYNRPGVYLIDDWR